MLLVLYWCIKTERQRWLISWLCFVVCMYVYYLWSIKCVRIMRTQWYHITKQQYIQSGTTDWMLSLQLLRSNESNNQNCGFFILDRILCKHSPVLHTNKYTLPFALKRKRKNETMSNNNKNSLVMKFEKLLPRDLLYKEI